MNNKLENYVEIQAEKAESLSLCRGLKLLHVRDQVEEILDNIGKIGIFEEYTVHSIKHIDEMLGIIEWLIPEETKIAMTSAEWLMLTLAVYFHDLGMVVTKEEYDNRYNSEFKKYKDEIVAKKEKTEYIEYVQKQGDCFLYQEFVRENHAKRIRQWIEGNTNTELGETTQIRKIVDDILNDLDKMFRLDLAMICESHHKDDIGEFNKYRVNNVYGNSKQERVNLNYIAIILRIADLLHITRDRTPSITRKIINVSNPTSVVEWEKQKAVRAVQPKLKRDGNENINETLEKDTIEITAYFEGAETAEAYFGLSSYLQYTSKELKKCYEIVEKSRKQEGALTYKFPWKEIDESRITVIGFEPKKLQFTIAQENILQLLVGHTLYNDSSVVVRELVQNAIDAVKLQKQYEMKKHSTVTDGKIQVDWNEEKKELCFWDNGTGMTISDVENYLLKVGASKYRDDSVRKEFPDFSSISHFGIGILTCFMIANDIDIVTNSEEQDDVNCINLRKVNGSYLLSKIEKADADQRIRKHGTMVKLYVRNDVDMSSVEDDLKKWIVLPEIPVFLTYKDENEVKIGYDSLKDVLIRYLNDTGRNVDGIKYDVYEENHGNVAVAYAVRHLRYLSDWCLMEIDRRRMNKKCQLPIGTCVEGIRVEFTTPGYKNSSILAIANIKNSKYQTNVARSAIELDANGEILSDIYDVYTKYIQGQMDKLENLNYSKSWAISEGRYLMRPLLQDELSNERMEPVDENILTQRMARLKCIVLENQGQRNVVSAEEVYNMEEVNIFESKMTQAAEYLLKEIRSEATLNNLIGIVCSQDNFLQNVDNIFCNYDGYNILHQYSVSNKEVSKIVVNHSQRRIKLTYSQKNNIWYEFDIRNRGFIKSIFIPKNEFVIEGLKEEIGVRTFGTIYMQSNTEFYKYIVKMISVFMEDETDENRMLLEIFLGNVFDSRILEQSYVPNNDTNNMVRQLMEDRFVKVSDELIEKMWNKIDVDEFSKIVLTKNYSLYSIDNWSRKEDGIQ